MDKPRSAFLYFGNGRAQGPGLTRSNDMGCCENILTW